MKLRLRRSVLGNAQFGLAVGLALVSGFGCSDDDSVPDIPMFDGGADAAVDTETTGGGGGTTEPDESTTETPTSETSDTDTLVVNPTDTGSSTSTSEPMPTSDVPTTDDPSSDVSSVPTGETSDPTSVPPDTSETMDTGSTSDTGGSSEEFPNLIANGGFESGSTGWSTWTTGSTLMVSSAKARSGQQSLLVSGGTGTGPASTTITPIMPGGTYEVTFWASVGTGSASVRIVRSLACADNQYLWVVGNTTVSSTDWTELTGQFTVPDDCDSTSFQVYAEGSAAGVDLYVDDVSVTLLPSDDTSGTDTSGTDVPDSGTDTMDPSTTGDDVDSGVMDTSGMTEEWPDGGVDASSTEPVDTSGEVVTEPDASVTTDVMTSDDVTSTAEETTSAADTTGLVPYGPNIIVNSTFEDNGDWWYGAGGAVARTDAQAHTGTWSLVTSGRTETYQGPAVDLLSASFANPPVEAGKTYYLEAYVRLTTGTEDVMFSIAQTCDTVASYPTVGSATASDAGWVLVSGFFTVPTALDCVALTQFQLYAQGPAASTNIYIDDVTVREELIQ